MKALINTVIATLVTTTSAFAASGAREDNSGFLVWGFLGMCALIVVGQLLPTVLLMLGFAKGVTKATKAESH
jgi:hypothetical protein